MRKLGALLLFLMITTSGFFYGCSDFNNDNINSNNRFEDNRNEEEEEVAAERRNDYGIVPGREIDYNTGYQLRGQGADGSLSNDRLDDGTGRFILKGGENRR